MVDFFGIFPKLGHLAEHIAHITERVDAVTLTGNDDRVDNCRALACIGGTDEQEVFLADGGGTHGVFDQVVIQADLPVFDLSEQGIPLTEQIAAGLAQRGFGAAALTQLQNHSF